MMIVATPNGRNRFGGCNYCYRKCTDIYIPPNEFLTPINSKRLIKPRNLKDFKTTNILTDHARNNSQNYRVDLTKTVVYRYSFFPRTTIDWNNLEKEIAVRH